MLAQMAPLFQQMAGWTPAPTAPLQPPVPNPGPNRGRRAWIPVALVLASLLVIPLLLMGC
jgi:hypothetical protein